MTIIPASGGYYPSAARKLIVRNTIDSTRRRDAIEAIKRQLRGNTQNVSLQKIRTDPKTPHIERDQLLEEEIRNIAIKQQYDIDDGFAGAVNNALA